MRSLVLVAVGASACGVVVDEDTFEDQYPEDMCNRAIACLWDDVPQDLEACVAERAAVLDQFGPDCLYDGSAAGECLRDLRGLSCEETQYRFPDAFPGQCGYVYTCTTTTGYY